MSNYYKTISNINSAYTVEIKYSNLYNSVHSPKNKEIRKNQLVHSHTLTSFADTLILSPKFSLDFMGNYQPSSIEHSAHPMMDWHFLS